VPPAESAGAPASPVRYGGLRGNAPSCLGAPATRGAGSAFIDHVDHQGDTPAPHDTPIDHQDQCLQGQMTQQHLGIGYKINFIGDLIVLDPPGKSFDTALGLVAIGHVGGNAGQLCALAAYNTADERREGGQVPSDCACWLARIPLC